MAAPLAPSVTTPETVAKLLGTSRFRWLTPDEVFQLLLTNQAEFGLSISTEPPSRPAGGTLFLIDKRACRFFRRDGHNWRKKKDGKNVQESHMDLRVRDVKRLYCTYTTAEDVPLKRRCYWLLDCPELEHLVLVHYLHSSGSSLGAPSGDLTSLGADLTALTNSATAAAGSRGSGSLGDASAELLHAGSSSMGSGQLPHGLSSQAIVPQVAVQGEAGMVWASVPAPLPGYGMGSGEVMAQVGSSDGLLLAQPVPLPAAQQQQQQQQQFKPPAPPSPNGEFSINERSYERQISGAFRKKLSLEPDKYSLERSAGAASGATPVTGQAWPQAQQGQELPPEHLLPGLQGAGLSLLNSLLSGEFDPTDLPPFGDLTPDGHEEWAPGSLHPHPEQPKCHLPAPGAGLVPLPSNGSQAWQLHDTHAQLLHLPGSQAEQLPDPQALPTAQELQLPAPEAEVLQPGGLTWQGSELERFFKQLEEEEEQRRKEGGWQGEGEAGVEAHTAGLWGNAEGSAGCGSGGMRSLNRLDSTLSWLAPLRRMLSGAGGSAPKLPSWLPDLSLDAPPEREGQSVATAEAGEAGGSLDGHLLVLSSGGEAEAEGQPADATNPPIMLPRQRRRMQQLATAQGGPGAENGAQAAPGKPVGSMLGRRRGLEKQGSAVPGPSQRLKPGQDVEPLHAS